MVRADPFCPVCTRYVMDGQPWTSWKGHRVHLQCGNAKRSAEHLQELEERMRPEPMSLREARAVWFELEEMW